MTSDKPKTITFGQAVGIAGLSVTLFVGLMSLYDTRIVPIVLSRVAEQYASKEVMLTIQGRLDTLATRESIERLQHRLDQIESRLMHLERERNNK